MSKTIDLPGFTDVAEAILAIIRRHPVRERRLIETLSRFAPEEVEEVLRGLESSGQVRRRVYRGVLGAQRRGLGDSGGTKPGIVAA